MHAAVIMWPDAFGLRPSMRDMGKRLAGAGYVVLVPNPFYRVSKAPVFGESRRVQLPEPAKAAMLQKLMGTIGAADAAERDAAAFVTFLDAQPQVNKTRKIGMQGYCMGGPLVSEPRPPCPTASAPEPRSTAAAWSRRARRARTCWYRR